MKIAWYTPFSIHSAIGQFSSEVLQALQSLGHQVTLVRSEIRTRELEIEKIHPFQGTYHWASDWDSCLESRRDDFDLVVYNIGDNYPNHGWCLSHQKRVPGITILHDYIIHGLLHAWEYSNDSLRKPYVQVLSEECDPSALEEYNKAVKGDIVQEWFLTRAASHPVFRFAMLPTLGIVTHAKFYRDICAQRIGCPVKTIPLAYRGKLDSEDSPVTQPVGRHSLITIGNANSNKCYESIIQAIGNSADLASAWSYRIVGHITKEYQRHLSTLAVSMPHRVHVEFMGRIDPRSLKNELYSAQAISCLRNPILEGASASVIESMQSGRPTIVSDAGCYTEIPDDCVYKVPLGREIELIQRTLNEIQRDPQSAAQRGKLARSWAIERHRGDRYAESFMEFANEVLYQQPIIEMVDRIANYVAGWTAVVPPEWNTRLDHSIRNLFPNYPQRSLEQVPTRRAV